MYKIRRMIEILNPAANVAHLRDWEGELRAEMCPKWRSENVTTQELVEAGLALFKEAESTADTSPKSAVLARNGLMVALLALHPIRHRNLFELTLGSSIRFDHGRWWISLEAERTKAGRY